MRNLTIGIIIGGVTVALLLSTGIVAHPVPAATGKDPAPLIRQGQEARKARAKARDARCLPAVSYSRPFHQIRAGYRHHAVHGHRAKLRVDLGKPNRCNPTHPPATIRLGAAMARAYGWTGYEWDCLRLLWGPYESGWYVYADNPSSDAYGIPQALPGWKMGPGWQWSARVQIRWGLGYVRGRYGTPCSALSFRRAAGWY